ncbi:MAG: TolC family protein [Phycisphaerales bacterium JB040]
MPTPSLPTRPTECSARAVLATALVLAWGGAGGCTNPFGSSPLDIDTRVSEADTNRVRSLNLRSYQTQTLEEAVRTETDPQQTVERALSRSGETDPGEPIELTIEEVRAATLANNLELSVSLVNPSISSQQVRAEEGRFEAAFTLDASWTETDQPTATTLSGSQTRSQSVTPGLRIPLRTGGSAEVTLPFNRFETDNAFATLNPSSNADLQFSLSHNLLRGAGRRATTHALRIANYNLQISQAQTKLAVIRQLAASDRAYWRLYAAQRALDVRVQQYELAREQYDRAVRLFDAGQTAQIEVVRSQSGLADRVEQVIRAQNAALLAERTLKRLLNLPGLDVDSPTPIVALSPPDPVRYRFDTSELAGAAIDNRMEMLELELRLASDAATEALARNNALPLLAMSYTYRINGLGGTEGDAFESLEDNNFEDWSIGLTSEIPLGNEERKAEITRAVLTRLQRLASREDRAQAITKEVYDAADTLASNWQRILAARESVILNTRLLEAEQNQFENQANTATDVLDADTQLAQARLTEIDAIVEYQIAQIDLAFATGTLLGAARLEFDTPDADDVPETYEPQRWYHPASGILPVDEDPETVPPLGSGGSPTPDHDTPDAVTPPGAPAPEGEAGEG